MMNRPAKYFLSLLILPLLIFTIGCTAPADNDQPEEPDAAVETDTAAVKAEIEYLRNTFTAMVQSGNYQAMQEIAHPDFMAVGPYGPEWDSLRSMGINGQYPTGTMMVITPAEFRIVGEG